MSCRWPEKVKYANRTQALIAARHWQLADPGVRGLEPYQCGKHWHLGRPSLEQKIRKALRRGWS